MTDKRIQEGIKKCKFAASQLYGYTHGNIVWQNRESTKYVIKM